MSTTDDLFMPSVLHSDLQCAIFHTRSVYRSVPDPSCSLPAKHFHFPHHTLYPLQRFLDSFCTQFDHQNDREIKTDINVVATRPFTVSDKYEYNHKRLSLTLQDLGISVHQKLKAPNTKPQDTIAHITHSEIMRNLVLSFFVVLMEGVARGCHDQDVLLQSAHFCFQYALRLVSGTARRPMYFYIDFCIN